MSATGSPSSPRNRTRFRQPRASRRRPLSLRIGLLGGSFDPPHNGHLLAAGDAFDALSLDRLIFIPAAVQPLKVGQAAATLAAVEMVRLLVQGDERFDVELDRNRTGRVILHG